MDQVRIVLDESGTPGDGDAPFVTAGVTIYGDWKDIESQWAKLVRNENFPIKGTKYTESQFLTVVDFLITNQILPVVSSHQLAPDVAAKLAERTREFVNHQTPQGLQGITHAHYIWVRHLLLTVAQSLIPITRHLGPIDRLDVVVDKFSLTDEMRDFVVAVFDSSFSPNGSFRQWIQTQAARYANVPELATVYSEIDSGFQVVADGYCLDMNPRGALK